jgi:uncharacterized protein (DUF362 family)
VSFDPRTVAVFRGAAQYPTEAPFHPSERYPEYDGPVATGENAAYSAVRSVFRLAGIDQANYGTKAWNPLGEWIRPGQFVLLKPNFVKERHPRDAEGWRYVMTHGSVIRAVADYVFRALDGRGKVMLADGPQSDSSFDDVVGVLSLREVAEHFRAQGLDFELVDLRQHQWSNVNEVIVARMDLPGDPNGYVALNLGPASEFVGHRGAGNYYGADYDSDKLNSHHTGGKHEYLLSGSAIKCDVLFSLPKLKTHKKAGITASLKNLVGVNGDKNWLPHHTEGSKRSGGDEHPDPGLKHRFERKAAAKLRRLSLALPGVGPWIHMRARRAGKHVFGDTETVIRSGNWWGNDTVWRMCLDLNKAIAYGNADGTFRTAGPENRKTHLVLVDGIIAGEGNGPMNPDPVAAGVVLFGANPPSVDAACARLMGFDIEKIPIVRQAFHCEHYPLAEWDWRDIHVVCNEAPWNRRLCDVETESTLHFKPHFGWKGHVEQQAKGLERTR